MRWKKVSYITMRSLLQKIVSATGSFQVYGIDV